MKYKAIFTVIYSKKTGKILEEIWEPRQRLFWLFPWMKLPGKPKFRSWEELESWFSTTHPEEDIKCPWYGKELGED